MDCFQQICWNVFVEVCNNFKKLMHCVVYRVTEKIKLGVSLCMTEPLCCTAEIGTTLEINYTLRKVGYVMNA